MYGIRTTGGCGYYRHGNRYTKLLSPYSYWYNNGCLLPDLITVFVAVDKADVGNGCLKVLFVGVAVGGCGYGRGH